MKKYKTNFRTAVNWLNNNLILCNNLPEVDESIFDNMRFDYYNEEDDEYIDIYQWFITDCNETDVEFLEQHFSGIYFAYSEKLDCFILCVDHFGTAWDGVYCETDLEMAKRN